MLCLMEWMDLDMKRTDCHLSYPIEEITFWGLIANKLLNSTYTQIWSDSALFHMMSGGFTSIVNIY